MSLRFPIWAVLLLLIIAVGTTYYFTEKRIREEYEELIREYGEQMDGYIEYQSEKERSQDRLEIKCPDIGMDAAYLSGDTIYYVTALDVGGKADKAGINTGDLIIAVNGTEPSPEIMEALTDGDVLTIKLVGEDGRETGETFDAVIGGESDQ